MDNPEIVPNGKIKFYYSGNDCVEPETVYGDVYCDENTKKCSALIKFKPSLKSIDLSTVATEYAQQATIEYVPGYKDQYKSTYWENSPKIWVKPKELLAIKNKKPKGKDSKDIINNLNQRIQDLQT